MAYGAWEWGGANSWSAGRLEFTSYSNGSEANSSRVDIRLYARRTDGGNSYNYNVSNNFWVQCNGSTQYETWQSVSGSGWTLVCAKSFTVAHNSDGTKTVNISGGGSIPGTTFNINSYSVNITLDQIPRYANITSFVASDVSQTSASFTWSVDATCDFLQYSLNNGSWVDAADSPFSVSDLTPNTSYSIKIQVRRQDSQLWSTSGTINFKTLPIVTISNGDNLNFQIGNNLTVNFQDYNMNNSSLVFSVLKSGTTDQWVQLITANISSGTKSYTIAASGVASQLYQNCPGTNSVRFRIDLSATIDSKTYTNSYYGYASINSTSSKPTFSNYTYGNTVSNVNTMLGNSSYMIQNYGNMRATITTSNKAQSNNGATIKYYVATITNQSNVILDTQQKTYSSTATITFDFGSFSAVGTYHINITAFDSRGLNSNVVTKTFYVLAYHVPTLSIVIDRVNNFEQEIELNLTTSYSKVLLSNVQKNSLLSIKYRYRESGTSTWGSYVTISSTSTTSTTNDITASVIRNQSNPLLSLPSENSYDFEFVVTDEIVSVSNIFTLAQGIPILIEGDDGHVAVGMVPDWGSEDLFQVASDITATDNNGQKKSILKEIQLIRDILYPVGSIYCSVNSTNPSTIYGGTWERIKGKCLVGVDENDSDFSASKKQGGEKEHQLLHDELPYHDHGFLGGSFTFLWGDKDNVVAIKDATAYAGKTAGNGLYTIQGDWWKTDMNATTETPHNNMQPYYTVYMWVRTA